MAIAVVMVRGTTRARNDVVDTLKMLNLTRANHCVLLPQNPSVKGMLVKAQSYVTWGEVSPQTIARLLLKRAHVSGGATLTDVYVKGHSKYSSIWDFAQALAKGEASPADVKGLSPVLRLPPPKKGYRSVKHSYVVGGDLGDRGKEIETLLGRMLGEEK